jgi:hypothetical protein
MLTNVGSMLFSLHGNENIAFMIVIYGVFQIIGRLVCVGWTAWKGNPIILTAVMLLLQVFFKIIYLLMLARQLFMYQHGAQLECILCLLTYG